MEPDRGALIVGSGLTAEACHVLLRKFGWETIAKSPPDMPEHPSVPYMVVDKAALDLMTDVFGNVPPLNRRVNRKIVVRARSGETSDDYGAHYVLSDAGLKSMLNGRCVYSEKAPSAPYTIQTSDSLQPEAWTIAGQRSAWICEAYAKRRDASDSLIFEFAGLGWAFWAPTDSTGSGFLQFVLPTEQGNKEACIQTFRSTRLLQEWISPSGVWLAESVACAPSWRHSLFADQMFFCGSAAMRLDPIAGDGIGTSLRSALLTCAAIRYCAERPIEREDVMEHLNTRMTTAMRSHLRNCLELYSAARLGGAWNSDLVALADLVARLCPSEPKLRFRLVHMSLDRL